MNCKNCGLSIPGGGRFCPNCGSVIAAERDVPAAQTTGGAPQNAPVSANVLPQTAQLPVSSQEAPAGNHSAEAGNVAGYPPPYPGRPVLPVPPAPQGQNRQTGAPVQQKNGKTKREKSKKKPSGCLIAFLVFLAIGIVFGLLAVFLIGKFLPGGTKGNSGNQQVQPAYSESAPSTQLREQLGGTYTPDENDFRFEDDSITGYVDHVILVFFKAGVSDDEVRRVAALANGELIGCIDSLNCFELRVPVSGRDELDALCETLLREQSVFRACTDDVDRFSSTDWTDPGLEEVVTDDPWGEWTWIPQEIRNVFFQQWSMLFPRGHNWHQELIGAPSAWAYSDYYSPVSVGVFDGGFDTEHPDLQITVVDPYANGQTLKDKEMADEYNHGTHVAGIIGATRGNGEGINGILAGPYSIYGFCMKNLGVGNHSTTSINLLGCSMLLDRGCRVINRSRGSGWTHWEDEHKVVHNLVNSRNRPTDPETGNEYTDDKWFEDGVKAAKDVLVLLEIYGPEFILVNSAGNDGIDALYNGWICSVTRDCAERAVAQCPGSSYTADDVMNAIIVAGAVANNKNYGEYSLSAEKKVQCDRHLELTSFSDFGDQVTVCAPGDYIYSTVRGKYDSYRGTSMAAPIVAACAAQIWSVDLNQTPGQVKARLVSSAVDGVETVSRFDVNGRTYPMVNLKDAVESLLTEEGRIVVTRPDGDLRRLVEEYLNDKLETGLMELESVGEVFAEDLAAGRFGSAFGNLRILLNKAFTLLIYVVLYFIAEAVLPGGVFGFIW